MSRKAKYATLTRYQPYIDVIRKALDIPEDAFIDIKFINSHVYNAGHAWYSPDTKYGELRLYKGASHIWTLKGLLHEFKHIQQYATRRLTGSGKNATWLDKRVTIYGSTKKELTKYMDSPWEIEARDAEELAETLFPKGKLVSLIRIGKIGNTTYFKKIKG